MAQHRWSIPFVGGYTYIQSEEEFNQTKERISMKLSGIKSFFRATTDVVVGAAVITGRKVKETKAFDKVKGVVTDLQKEGQKARTKEEKKVNG